MSVVLSLKTFSIKLRGLRVWKAYDVGPAGKCFTPTHDEWIWKTSRAYRPMRGAAFNCTLRSRILSNFVQSIEEESQVLKPTRVHFPYPEEGHTKNVLRVFCSLQKHMDADKHLIRLQRTASRERGLNSHINVL